MIRLERPYVLKNIGNLSNCRFLYMLINHSHLLLTGINVDNN
mgnify:CR=1 FL=1